MHSGRGCSRLVGVAVVHLESPDYAPLEEALSAKVGAWVAMGSYDDAEGGFVAPETAIGKAKFVA